MRGRDKEVVSKRNKAWRARNPNYQREWYQDNKDWWREYDRNRRAKRLNVEGSFTLEEFRAVKELCGFRCVKCGIHESAIGTLHADHILPLSKGGTNTISNIQPLCPRDNLKKGNRESVDYRPRAERE